MNELGIGYALAGIAAIAAVTAWLVDFIDMRFPVRPRDVKHTEAYTNAQAKNKYMED
ncbi:hypothetical protein WEIDD23_01902 [Weissella sp. DD23]|uniref:hypothetical protein n=1 Tax=Weissella sp. DD23 TaxID=1777865 RepID=UPI000791798C|nr:hypothetical protein [Weissella sp. DD23]KXU03056.1 hypothetical protein WEIDD23_01902 [Weissella sp. DD23]